MGESMGSAPPFWKSFFEIFFQLASWVAVRKHVWSKEWPKYVPELPTS
jgi:hypothetical protein